MKIYKTIMQKTFYALSTFIALFFLSCTSGQTQSAGGDLAPADFAAKMQEMEGAVLVDVRTPGEFSRQHLQNAQNINWNSSDFVQQVSKLDKDKPVFVYCLSGARSAAAVNKMRSIGFKEVYNMKSGLVGWNAANLSLSAAAKKSSQNLTVAQFNELVKSDKVVLVDFYADWCAPCKKMEPYLKEIERDMSSTVKLVRIDADKNPQLLKELGIDAIPVLQVYKNNKMTWNYKGFISKEEVVKQL